MKRSEINAIMRDADAFICQSGWHLPPFAHWTPQDWAERGPEAREVAVNGLGWDITDFGQGDYRRMGLFLFTLRNGHPDNLRAVQGKLYAEKLLVVDEGQVTPMHFHWAKCEDIINRSGGRLAIQLYNATPDEDLDDSAVTVSLDGVRRTVRAGEVIELAAGESITLPTRLYHSFWGVGRRVLVGEVSVVNDDTRDNRFHQPMGRFSDIQEDEPPWRLLAQDYPRYYKHF